LLKGMVVSQGEAFDGEVLVVGNALACVQEDCSAVPGAEAATVIETNGLIYPGLIDTHNHILYNVFDTDDWSVSKLYENHNQWTSDPGYQEMQDAYDNLITKAAANLKCEVLKYGELKSLIGGTTAVLGSPKGSPMKCYASLARTIDGQFNDLPKVDAPPGVDPLECTANASADHIQVSSLGLPTPSAAEPLKANFDSCKTWAYVVHVAEGTPENTSAYNEWIKLLDLGLNLPQVTVVHGTALAAEDFQTMADSGMGLVWSPSSNAALYGLTTNVPAALATDPPLTVALAPDWSLSGAISLLDELDFARKWSNEKWEGVPTSQQLVQMATINAAEVLAVDPWLGSLTEGKLADLIVVQGDVEDPWNAVIDAGPGEIRMVMVDGVILYGDAALEPAMALEGCEALDVCGQARLMCAAEASEVDKLGQTMGDIEGAISGALSAYDETNGTAFAPIAPLFTCEP